MLLARAVRAVVAAGLVAAGIVVAGDLVEAAGKEIRATSDGAKCDKTWGPPCFTPANGTITQINQGETVTWRGDQGTHTVTPVDPSAFEGSGDLTGPDSVFSVTFDKPGVYAFYCKHHGSVEDDGKTHHGMWGKIEVKATGTPSTTAPPPPPPPPSPPDPPPTTQPPSTTTTRPAPQPTAGPPTSTSHGATTGGGSSGPAHGQTAAGTGRPWVGPPPTAAAPPPTRTAAAPDRDSEPPKKEREKDRDEGAPENAAGMTSVPPDELVLPPSPQFPTATTAPTDTPAEIPQGEAVAVIKNETGGGRRQLILFGTLFGVGAFAFGVGAWKFTHRSSKYWPA